MQSEIWKNLIIFNAGSEVERLCDLLLEMGALSTTVTGNEDNNEIEKAWFNEPGEPKFGNWKGIRIAALFDPHIDLNIIKSRILDNFTSIDLEFQEEIIEDQDWVLHTQKLHDPIEIVPGTWLLAPWHQIRSNYKTTILLDPGLGFGTGTHPTTRLCLEWLCRNVKTGQSMIDYGCGSGVLGITAAVHGSNPVMGIDIDQNAIDATLQNALLNNVTVETGFPSVSDGRKFQIVVANILAKPLIELAESIYSLLDNNGRLILAGILDTQGDSIINAYKPFIDLKISGQIEKWVLLTGENS